MMKSNFILENVSKYFANHKNSVIFIKQITNKTTNNNINNNNNNNNNNKRLMSLRQIERFIKIMHLIPKRDFVGVSNGNGDRALESPQAISKKFRYSQSQFTKKYFDIYRRCNPGFDQKDSVRLHPEVDFSTTLGQANFFEFFFENRLDQIIANLIDKLGGGGISKVFETYDPKKSKSKSKSKSNQNQKNKKNEKNNNANEKKVETVHHHKFSRSEKVHRQTDDNETPSFSCEEKSGECQRERTTKDRNKGKQMTSNPMPDQVQKNNYHNPFDPNPNMNPNRQSQNLNRHLNLSYYCDPPIRQVYQNPFFSTRVMNNSNRVRSQFGMNKKQHKLPGISIYSSSN